LHVFNTIPELKVDIKLNIYRYTDRGLVVEELLYTPTMSVAGNPNLSIIKDELQEDISKINVDMTTDIASEVLWHVLDGTTQSDFWPTVESFVSSVKIGESKDFRDELTNTAVFVKNITQAEDKFMVRYNGKVYTYSNILKDHTILVCYLTEDYKISGPNTSISNADHFPSIHVALYKNGGERVMDTKDISISVTENTNMKANSIPETYSGSGGGGCLITQ
jgi:hypothetical protein